MKLLVKPLLEILTSLSMDKSRSIIKVESRTSTIDQQVSKVITTTLRTLWFLLQLQVPLMEPKLKETWTGARGNEVSLLTRKMAAEGGDTDVIRVEAVVGAVAKVWPLQLLQPEQQGWLCLNMKRGSNVRGKRRKNANVSMEISASVSSLLIVFQARKQLNRRRMAKIRTHSIHISQIAHHLLDIQLRDNRLLIILLHPAKSTLVSRLPLPASSIQTTITHHKQATHLRCPTPILLLPEQLDTLSNPGSPGGLMRM